jgi:ribonuclease HI
MTMYRAWCDGSASMDNVASIGYIIFDSNEEVIYEHNELIHYTDNSNLAEYIALSQLVKKINELNLDNTYIFMDSLNVFNHLQEDKKIGDGNQDFYQIIKNEIIFSFLLPRIIRIDSSQNRAHNVSKKVISEKYRQLTYAYRRVFSNPRPRYYTTTNEVVLYYKKYYANNQRVNFDALQRLLTRNILVSDETTLYTEESNSYLYTYEDMNIYVVGNTIVKIEKIPMIQQVLNNNIEKMVKILDRLLKVYPVYKTA